MSLKVDRVQLEIIINNDQARKQLRELDEEARKLTSEMKKLDKTSVEYAQKAARLKAVKQQMDSIHESIGLTNMTMRELSSRQKDLNAILRNLRPGTEEYRKLKEEVNLVSARMSELRGKSQTTGSSLNGMAGSFRKYIGVISAGVATVSGFVYGIKRAVDMYYEEEKALKKVEQAIKSTGGAAGLSLKELKKEASELQKKTIFGDETILNDVTAQLLTFTNVTGSTFLRAQEAAMDLSTVLDGDLKSASIMLGKALNDPIQGLTAMRRVGIAFTDQQRAQIKELTEGGRLMEAQGLILSELNRQYGGQAQAAAKGVGALTQMNNKISDVGETIGKFIAYSILPAITQIGNLADRINDSLSSALQSSTEKFNDQLDNVIDLTQNISPLADRYDELILKSNRSTSEQSELNEIIKTISTTIPGAVTKFDDYGNAISISTTRVREFIQAEQDRLKVVNAEAIKENKKKLKSIENELAESQKKIKQIEETGSFQVVEVIRGTTTQQNLIKRQAVESEVAEEQEKYRNLISQKNGYNTEIERLNGDYIKKEQDKREQDRKNAEELEKKKQAYKKLSLSALKKMAEEGDLLAEEELNQRKSLDKNKDSAKKAATEYEKLSEAIGEAKKKMLDFIAAGKFPEAKQAGALLKSLELQQKVANKISEAGGDINKFLTDLTDDTQGLLDEIGEVDAELMNLEWFKKSVQKYKSSESEKETNKQEFRTNIITNEYETTTKKNEDNKFDKDFYLSAIDTASSAAFDIWRSKTDARLEYETAALNKQMEKELSNKNLTEEQKDKIKDKYAKKEAKLKTEAFKKQKSADIIQAIINTALAVAKALPNIPLSVIAGIAGAAQIATIVAQPVPQFAKGRYNVIGADDNRLYNAKYSGTPETKIYTSPSLIAEQGSELIVDAKTTRNLMMNYPGIIEAIYAARVPQRASGNLDTVKLPSGSDPALLLAVNRLNENIEKGIKGKWVLYDLEQAQDKLADIRNESTF